MLVLNQVFGEFESMIPACDGEWRDGHSERVVVVVVVVEECGVLPHG